MLIGPPPVPLPPDSPGDWVGVDAVGYWEGDTVGAGVGDAVGPAEVGAAVGDPVGDNVATVHGGMVTFQMHSLPTLPLPVHVRDVVAPHTAVTVSLTWSVPVLPAQPLPSFTTNDTASPGNAV